MIGLNRWYFGIGIYHPKHEVNFGTLFRSAVCFGAAFCFTVGRRYLKQASDTINSPRVVPMFNAADLHDLKERVPHGCRIVGVELLGSAKPITPYAHPAQCLYLLGAEDHGLPPAILAECHEHICIPGLKACLNVAVAGSVVMYDRMLKSADTIPRELFDKRLS